MSSTTPATSSETTNPASPKPPPRLQNNTEKLVREGFWKHCLHRSLWERNCLLHFERCIQMVVGCNRNQRTRLTLLKRPSHIVIQPTMKGKAECVRWDSNMVVSKHPLLSMKLGRIQEQSLLMTMFVPHIQLK